MMTNKISSKGAHVQCPNPSILIALLVALSVCFFSTASAFAESPECADLRDQITQNQDALNRIAREEADRQQELALGRRTLGSMQSDLIYNRWGTARGSAGSGAAIQRLREEIRDILDARGTLYQQSAAAAREANEISTRLAALRARYVAAGCGDPPENCAAEPVEVPSTAGSTSSSAVRRDADLAARSLFTRLPSLPPVLAQIRANGSVVDFFTRDPIPNPANAGEPLRVQFGADSPFRSGLIVTVSYSRVRLTTDPSQSVTLVRFNGRGGEELLYGPSSGSSGSAPVPSVGDVFPNGFFVIPTVPSGALVPLGNALRGFGVGTRSALEFLRQLLEASPTLSPISRREDGTDCGWQATFHYGTPATFVAVGHRCAASPYGEWEWRSSSIDGHFSIKFTETLRRDSAWSPIGDVGLWVHMPASPGMTEIARDIYREAIPAAQESFRQVLAGWQARVSRPGRREVFGSIQWRKTGVSPGTFPRSSIERGCKPEDPPGYSEENVLP